MYSDKFIGKMPQYPPSLLERLQDDEPKSLHDRARTVDSGRMRELIKNDIADFINHTNIEDTLDEHKHRLVMDSVLNYGIPALTGSTEYRHSRVGMENIIRNAILRFEPRIVPETLLVRLLPGDEYVARHAVILFEIRGLIYWKPRPVDLCMSGRYDIESEKVDLKPQ